MSHDPDDKQNQDARSPPEPSDEHEASEIDIHPYTSDLRRVKQDKVSPSELNFTLDIGTPKTIGPYKILELIKEAGMGLVYRAERTEPMHLIVALKVIKPGMYSKKSVARFEAEQQALALMNHRNVTKVFDAGTTEQGQPYFAMEYVAGVPITKHCDRLRLSIQQRLKLFMQVCDGVQHAHQKAIIHRDIKPSNILVAFEDNQSVAKVIDFGVAKAIGMRLAKETLFTERRQIVGTLEYMSPEQAEMTQQDIDTRTDIYSLGVLLYELLTGDLPLDSRLLRERAYEQIMRIIREVEPPKPSTKLSSIRSGSDVRTTVTKSPGSVPPGSEPPGAEPPGAESHKILIQWMFTLLKWFKLRWHGQTHESSSADDIARHRRTDPSSLINLLRGDLDWITMKALDKDRTRRYATASEFAEDIRRHLNHEPVIARPPSVTYLLSKFVRKQRVPLAVAAALLLAFGITVYSQIQASRAALSAAAMVRTYRVFSKVQARTKTGLDEARKVLADCTRAIELAPDVALPYALRAKALTLQDKNDAAWPDCTKALELEPTNSLAQRTMGYLRLDRGDFAGALEAYNRGMQALSFDEDLPRDFHNRARVHRILGHYDLALGDHNAAVALVPNVARVYLGRGITRRFRGDIEGALKDLSRAASLDPSWAGQSNLWIWEMRMLRGEPGDREKAEAALAAAQEAYTGKEFDIMIVDVCRGRVTADEMLSTATSDVMHCVAFYYLGAKALVDGRHAKARVWFQKCRDTDVHYLSEYDLAKWHLDQHGVE